MSKIKDFLLQHIFPGYYAIYSNKLVAKRYEEIQNYEVDLSTISQDQEKYYIEQVKLDIKEQYDRKKIIEDKSKSLLFIIAVSITAITFSLTYLNSIILSAFQFIALSFLGISILYFIQGAIKALQTVNVRQFHVIQVEVETIEQKFKLSAKKSDPDFLKDLIKSKQLNDLINIRLSNYTYASYNLIRNGIIFFAFFFATTILGNYVSKNDRTKDKFHIRKEIQIKMNDSIFVKIPYTFELKYDIQNIEIDEKKTK